MKSNEEAREMRRLNKVSNSNRPEGYNIPAKPQHTPTPWVALSVTPENMIRRLLSEANSEANAELIVLAVNAHQELLDAVKTLLDENYKLDHTDANFQRLHRDYSKLIAKAEWR